MSRRSDNELLLTAALSNRLELWLLLTKENSRRRRNYLCLDRGLSPAIPYPIVMRYSIAMRYPIAMRFHIAMPNPIVMWCALSVGCVAKVRRERPFVTSL